MNKKTGNSNWGSKPIPCKTCNHQSRDHIRNTKQEDGTWNGKCDVYDCNCKLYVREKFISEITPDGLIGDY